MVGLEKLCGPEIRGNLSDFFQLIDEKCLDDNMEELARQVDVIFTATPQGCVPH